jgi:hypothetical protein
MLHKHGATLEDIHDTLNRPGKRYKDSSRHTHFPRNAFASACDSLKRHGLYWLGQIVNPQGTKLIPRTSTGHHKESKWWKLLHSSASNTRHLLYKPLSPSASPIPQFKPTHRPGTIATSYTNDTETGEWEHYYYKITDSHIADDGRETCYHAATCFHVSPPVHPHASDTDLKIKCWQET